VLLQQLFGIICETFAYDAADSSSFCAGLFARGAFENVSFKCALLMDLLTYFTYCGWLGSRVVSVLDSPDSVATAICAQALA